MNRICLLFLIFYFIGNYARSQIKGNEEEYIKPVNKSSSSFYLGLSTGVNNFTGMFGPMLDFRVIPQLTLSGGIGLGGWGYKASAALKFYPDYPLGNSFNFGYSTCSGAQDVKMELETESPGGTQEVTMDFEKTQNINMSICHYWSVSSSGRFHIEFGYSVPLDKGVLYKLQDSSVKLNDASKDIMKLYQPGGIIFGIGITFGI